MANVPPKNIFRYVDRAWAPSRDLSKNLRIFVLFMIDDDDESDIGSGGGW